MRSEVRSAGKVESLVGASAVPEVVRSLSTFAEPNYVDLFTVTTPRAAGASPEEWARAVLEKAPLSQRNARVLWRLMGLRLGPRNSPDHVQGWKIAARGDNWIRVQTGSWYLSAEAICLAEDATVSVSLSLRYDRPIAALVWAVVSGPHQRALPVMLHQAVRIMQQ